MDIATLDLPDLHAHLLERVIAAVRADGRFEAVLGTGSLGLFGPPLLHVDLKSITPAEQLCA